MLSKMPRYTLVTCVGLLVTFLLTTPDVEAPIGSSIDSLSGVFPGLDVQPSTNHVPMPAWLLFGLVLGIGLIGSRTIAFSG